jgi:hypothetical protein
VGKDLVCIFRALLQSVCPLFNERLHAFIVMVRRIEVQELWSTRRLRQLVTESCEELSEGGLVFFQDAIELYPVPPPQALLLLSALLFYSRSASH